MGDRADSAPRDAPPRRPGAAKPRDVYVTTLVWSGLFALAAGALAAGFVIASGDDVGESRIARRALSMLGAVGLVLLVRAAWIAWRGVPRRRR